MKGDGMMQKPGRNNNGNNPPQMPGGDSNGNNPPQMPGGGNRKNQSQPFGGSENNSVIRVHVNGHILSFDCDPYIENDSTLVGFRSVTEALGASVEWDEKTKTLTAEGYSVDSCFDGEEALHFLKMGELAEFVCDEQADIHSGGSITLHKNFENNVIVKGDRYMLARLCINLVSNAYSYGRDGGNITVSVSHRDGNAVLSVADDGAGISKEDLPKIWERFYRADPSRTDNGGAGLGLSMVKWIAQYHGGTVSAESELKCGSVFTFTMPAE